MDGFLNSAPREFGERAYLGTVESGKKQLILEKPKGFWGKDQVECAIKVCGADHILFGTTFPVFYNWMSEGVKFIKTLDITEEERTLITSRNAIKLFDLKV